MFEDLGLRPAGGKFKRTKGGKISTQDKYLEAIRGSHPLVGLVIDRRELTKLKGTYVEPIPRLAAASPDRRLHPNFRVTRVPTGRLAATAPNLLAIPNRTELGRLIRAGFVAGQGRVLGSWDLDQIEMRIMAHIGRDPGFCSIFIDGRDVHAERALKIFGVEPGKQDKHLHRLPVKSMGFGKLMGMTAVGLLEQLQKEGLREWQIRGGVTRDMLIKKAQKLLDDDDVAYPLNLAYVKEQHRAAREKGYVTDFKGRRFYVTGVWSDDERVRAEADRQAQALPIQSGAQIVVKLWMARVMHEIEWLRE